MLRIQIISIVALQAMQASFYFTMKLTPSFLAVYCLVISTIRAAFSRLISGKVSLQAMHCAVGCQSLLFDKAKKYKFDSKLLALVVTKAVSGPVLSQIICQTSWLSYHQDNYWNQPLAGCRWCHISYLSQMPEKASVVLWIKNISPMEKFQIEQKCSRNCEGCPLSLFIEG